MMNGEMWCRVNTNKRLFGHIVSTFLWLTNLEAMDQRKGIVSEDQYR